MEKFNWITLSPTIITSIVVALVGSPIIITLIVDYLLKPNLNLTIIPNFEGDGRKSVIQIKNDGNKHATNISLVVFTPKKIISISDLISTKNILLPYLNKSLELSELWKLPSYLNETSLTIELPRVEFGKGSVTKIGLMIDGNKSTNYNNYYAVATYDQGSIEGDIIKSETDPIPFSERFQRFWDIYFNPFSFIFYMISIVAIPFLYKKIKDNRISEYNKINTNFQETLIENLIEIRKNLKFDRQSNIEVKLPDWQILSYHEKIKIFPKISHILLIDDLFIILIKRNILIDKGATKEELQKINETCIHYIDRILRISPRTKI